MNKEAAKEVLRAILDELLNINGEMYDEMADALDSLGVDISEKEIPYKKVKNECCSSSKIWEDDEND